ncbi:MAG: YchJ family metal-binding protein [Arcobacteraceae bacterium]
MKQSKKALCPCNRGKKYNKCCKRIHDGLEVPKSAVELMISRYAAYAMKRCDYIIQTTHKTNQHFMSDFAVWFKEIESFSQSTLFQGVKILDYEEQEKEAYVTFQAQLKQNGTDISFTEESRFIKENEKWYYQQAEIFEKI